ncbi:DeoR/GlpR family DNA-binding transcription regulator [Trueperella pyogenes]
MRWKTAHIRISYYHELMVDQRLLPRTRQAELAKRILSEGHMTVADLAAEFDVSADTIRRDLYVLDKAGTIVRAHGGAMNPLSIAKPDTRVDVRLKFKNDEKIAIAKTVADLIPDQSTLIVNGGTTTLQLAHALRDHRDLTIATNNLRFPQIIPANCFQDLYVFGGRVRSQMETTVGKLELPHGDLTQPVDFKADYAVIGVGGIVTDGYVTSNLAEGGMIAEMIAHSAIPIIVADDTKFNRSLFANIGPLSVAKYLVTNAEPPEDLNTALISNGVKVVIASL